MKSRLIVNPVSGTDAGPDYLPRINERLRERLGALEIVMTAAPGDAEEAGAEAARDGCDRLFVAGGDGTLNEALNGVAGVAGGLAQVTFGLIPLGTGNDFAAALGLPEDVEGALDVLLAGRTQTSDVGVLNGRHFINTSSGGFIAEVSDAIDARLKTLAGKFAFVIGGAQVLFDYEPVGARLRGVGAGGEIARELRLEMFAVCNSRRLGGGRMMAPNALIDDGELDICLFAEMPTLEFIALLPRVSGGDHLGDERVTYFRAAELEMQFDRRIKVNTDGEVLEAEVCRYHVLPRAARFLAGAAPFASPTAGPA